MIFQKARFRPPAIRVIVLLSLAVLTYMLVCLWRANSPRTPRYLPGERPSSLDHIPAPEFDLQPEFKLSQHLFPAIQNDSSESRWITHNQKSLNALFSCLHSSTAPCGQNQTSIVLMASYHFTSILEGHMAGEEIWARSTVVALENMGYTYLYTPHFSGSDGPSLSWAVQMYHLFPDLVKAVIVESDQSESCLKDSRCVLWERNPYGIPAWKIFSFSFWAQSSHPLGPKWSLSPEDWQLEHSWNAPKTYLGYSVELGCRRVPFVPHNRRHSPPQVYLLSKDLRHFKKEHHAWTVEYYQAAINATGVHFLVGAQGTAPPEFPKHLVENVGIMPPNKFYRTLSQSSVLVGVGEPATSPTMYDALCLGVPVVNPIKSWDPKNRTNRDQWSAQHALLKNLDPPYVYNVLIDDKEKFAQAIKDAIANPIQSYILDRMRMSSVEDRLSKILERDWKKEAEVLLEERKKSGQGELFTVSI